MSTSVTHHLDLTDGDQGPAAKKIKLSDGAQESTVIVESSVLPPSHYLLDIGPPNIDSAGHVHIREKDVGISEYLGKDIPTINGIIKQRFTDFLVYEVDQNMDVVHLKSLQPPEDLPQTKPSEIVVDEQEAKDEDEGSWPERFNTALSVYFDDTGIEALRTMLLEGPEPPRKSDSGWGSRTVGQTETTEADIEQTDTVADAKEPEAKRKDRNRDKYSKKGQKGGRKGADRREDNRKALSKPIQDKAERTKLHQIIRELFKGKLESVTDKSTSDDGSHIAVHWSRSKPGSGRGYGRPDRGNFPPYIHFTLQKTNRDTSDALTHLSKALHANVKDLSVAGTKDKRGITTQRVSFKRGNKTVQDAWKLLNGVNARRSSELVTKRRGERGLRATDLTYRRAPLELGMLKGNAFLITLRNVGDDLSNVDPAMNVLKKHGFINYYGMQRFGTASIPTHAIGLALLKADWNLAVELILSQRPGEHPEVVEARNAWLVDKDYEKALELMPRRVVAERCILESYKKQGGETRNAMGALSTIPRTLRLMYVHAYQSYVWNAIVSRRIRENGFDKPIAGDLVFESGPTHEPGSATESIDEMEVDEPAKDGEGSKPAPSNRQIKRNRKWVAAKVKTLTEADLDEYTIFDVLMPLPGTDVAYPGGDLGKKYRAFLEADGLDPDNFVRPQKEYTLGGSYRKILQLPKDLSWSVLSYTDPDIALAQADEDMLLGFDQPQIVEDGKFHALQVNLTLETAAYATMALREVTKTETGSQHQSQLTLQSDDQQYRQGLHTEAKEEEGSEEVIIQEPDQE